ncbi:hypothetical protein HB364_08710 [Pseudoflavitalea sp. X16]|uniref:hypothetical protein n=1 Tax=Paraflavitalea devenefica TaxID=2716334 RepID=UPI00141EC93F|nr:hypothetical protein [Paraflavitalea devenefica]NII25158.1 hypothetical protein [Paraflavitalea devenefica]
MGTKIIIPPKPDKFERNLLDNFLQLRDWHINMVKQRCTEIYRYAVKWDSETKSYIYAFVYGLRAVIGEAKEPCIANFFTWYETRLYQSFYLEEVVTLLKCLDKERRYKDYEHEQWELKIKERQLMASKKEKKKRTANGKNGTPIN